MGSLATKAERPTRVRHAVLWMTVLAYMITYMDRVVISTAAPSIRAEFGLSKETMGWILGAFQISYALFQIPGGWLGDKFGPRAALTGVVAWWSAFTAATVLTWNAGSLIVCRFLFGMGEAGPSRSRRARCRAGSCPRSAAGRRASPMPDRALAGRSRR